MTLYSSIFQSNILWLLLYLGFFSGSIYSLSTKIINALIYFCKRNKSFFANKKIVQKQSEQQLKPLKNKQSKLSLSIFKVKKQFLNVTFGTLQVFLTALKTIIFGVVIFLSYLTNLKYNFGQLSIFYFFIWGFSFYLGNVFVKLVAKFVLSFYNNFVKKVKLKHEKQQ